MSMVIVILFSVLFVIAISLRMIVVPFQLTETVHTNVSKSRGTSAIQMVR